MTVTSASNRPNPFEGFLPRAESAGREAKPARQMYVVEHVPSFAARALRMDSLDSYLLSCARTRVVAEELLDRLPCSREAGQARLMRLISLGALVVVDLVEAPSPSSRDGLLEVDADLVETVRPRR